MTRRWVFAGVATALVVVLAGAGVWWFVLRDDAPEAVSLEAAVEAASRGGGTPASTTAAASGSSAPPTSMPPGTGDAAVAAGDAAGIDGVWTVDASIGSFDFESATGSFVGFRVDEELTIGSATAVGRTGSVDGSLTIDGTDVTDVSIEADLSALTTNDSRRDRAARGALGTDDFPMATFVLTAPIDLGPGAAAGEPVAVTAVGELTVKGETQPVEVPIEAQLTDGVIALIGSTAVEFDDFGVSPPSAPIVVSVDDDGVVEFQLLLTRG